MPDRNGNPTLRDRFPIYCDVCQLMIKPTEYDGYGGCTSPAQSYWTLGHRLSIVEPQKPPANVYAHRDCMSWIPSDSQAPKERITGNYCVYCGEPSGKTYCCSKCKDQQASDMRSREPGDEVLELLRQLQELYTPKPKPELPISTEGSYPSTARGPQQKRKIDTENIGPFVPQNEMGVVFITGKILDQIGYRMAHIQQSFPDAVVVGRDNKTLRVEFEFMSSNFISHGHDPEGCDLVICWELNKSLPLPVIALARHYDTVKGTWDFSDIGRFASKTP